MENWFSTYLGTIFVQTFLTGSDAETEIHSHCVDYSCRDSGPSYRDQEAKTYDRQQSYQAASAGSASSDRYCFSILVFLREWERESKQSHKVLHG